MTWQPIETAPKDARILLLYSDQGIIQIVCGRWDKDGFAKRPRQYWRNDLSYTFGVSYTRRHQPTHWMPLPEPPPKGRG